MHAAGSVDDQKVGFALFGGMNRVECQSARVTALAASDNFDSDALAPDAKLVDSCSSESVAGGQNNLFAVFNETPGEFGDRCSLADTVYTDDEINSQTFRIENRI